METYKKKLIEVALPLEAINKDSAREKSIRQGHPSTIHLWWSRKPLTTCRGVLFASLVDDPSSHPDRFPTEESQKSERERLFKIIEELVPWESANNAQILAAAHEEIMRSTNGNPPPVIDPFCGGGSIPLEAQRLGLQAYAADQNPVAVILNKAVVEIPAKFANQPPVHPTVGKLPVQQWKGAGGLAEDVKHYGEWIRDEAIKRIGHLYPKVKLPPEHGGGEATVIAWLWTRTVNCPNPACGACMPLINSYTLSTKKDRAVWLEPIVDAAKRTVSFQVKQGQGAIPKSPKTGRGGNFSCLVCKQLADESHIKSQGLSGKMSVRLLATVALGSRGRLYCAASSEQEEVALQAVPSWKPSVSLPNNTRDIRPQLYGLTTYGDLFTKRQLTALCTFSDLIAEVRKEVHGDAIAKGMSEEQRSLAEGGTGALAYADAIVTYLALVLDRAADRGSSICTWDSSPTGEKIRNTCARLGLPMTWDFAEGNPFSESSGNWMHNVDLVARAIPSVPFAKPGIVELRDATEISQGHYLISTDPPYYDNIGYADLSDFFYVWLRRSLGQIYPKIFSTLMVPKSQELIAAPYRFGGDKQKAKEFFEVGLSKAFAALALMQDPQFPLTIYYAFKQSEAGNAVDEQTDSKITNGDRISTGWESMLEALLRSGFSITGTWPMRSELSNRQSAKGTNALASSIVLVCRPRDKSATAITRREFVAALKRELPDALRKLQEGSIAPVDLAQAAIGPGMSVFSRHSQVLEANGAPMSIRAALQVINQVLDEVLAEQDADYDADTRWAISWFEQHAFSEGSFGVAEVLSKAKDTALAGLVDAGILDAKAGKVRLLKRNELPDDWDPETDKRLTVWEITHHLIRTLEQGGIGQSSLLMQKVGSKAETAHELAYRLYVICERKKWAQDALAYNSLVVSWPEIKGAAARLPGTPKQLQTSEL